MLNHLTFCFSRVYIKALQIARPKHHWVYSRPPQHPRTPLFESLEDLICPHHRADTNADAALQPAMKHGSFHRLCPIAPNYPPILILLTLYGPRLLSNFFNLFSGFHQTMSPGIYISFSADPNLSSHLILLSSNFISRYFLTLSDTCLSLFKSSPAAPTRRRIPGLSS